MFSFYVRECETHLIYNEENVEYITNWKSCRLEDTLKQTQ